MDERDAIIEAAWYDDAGKAAIAEFERVRLLAKADPMLYGYPEGGDYDPDTVWAAVRAALAVAAPAIVAAERRRVTREIEAPMWKRDLCAALNELVDDEEAVEATGIAVAAFLGVVGHGAPEQEETT